MVDLVRWHGCVDIWNKTIRDASIVASIVTNREKEAMMDVEIWHYPRCSKSRKTLSLLEEHDIEPVIRRYREDPPDSETLDAVLQMLELEPRELMRMKENPYTELELDDDSLSRSELIDAMAENPILIQRPIVIVDDKAALGRPPEAVLDLLD